MGDAADSGDADSEPGLLNITTSLLNITTFPVPSSDDLKDHDRDAQMTEPSEPLTVEEWAHLLCALE